MSVLPVQKSLYFSVFSNWPGPWKPKKKKKKRKTVMSIGI